MVIPVYFWIMKYLIDMIFDKQDTNKVGPSTDGTLDGRDPRQTGPSTDGTLNRQDPQQTGPSTDGTLDKLQTLDRLDPR